MRTFHVNRAWLAAGFVAVLSLAAAGIAGSLNPPAGPPAPTFKTLHDVEPRTIITQADIPLSITTRGSYYLGENLIPAMNTNMPIIEILTDDVTVNLEGFTIDGTDGIRQSLSAVKVIGPMNNVSIRNGIVRDCTSAGIEAFVPGPVRGVTIEDITSYNNQLMGMRASHALIRNCVAYSNALAGIEAQDGSLIESCLVYDNGQEGIVAGPGSTVINCTSRSNTKTGIFAANGSTVRSNTSSFNTGDGILVTADCYVIDNTCNSNGQGLGSGAGVFVLGADCRIDGNLVTDNDRGIDVDISGNLIIRNSASGNATQYLITANNKVGTIVSAPNSLAINGSTGGAGVGTTNPWANISY